jgi:hypothetical protein
LTYFIIISLIVIIPTSIYVGNIDESNRDSDESTKTETWEVILAILIPLIGTILGFIHVGKNDKDGGKKLLLISILMMWFVAVIAMTIIKWL